MSVLKLTPSRAKIKVKLLHFSNQLDEKANKIIKILPRIIQITMHDILSTKIISLKTWMLC